MEDDTSNKYHLLSLMFCQEKYVDGEYIKTRYDLIMLLGNIGGRGGLCIVSDAFFILESESNENFSKELMVDDITTKGVNAFKNPSIQS